MACRYGPNCSDILRGAAAAPAVLDMCEAPIDVYCLAFHASPPSIASASGLGAGAIMGISAAAILGCLICAVAVGRKRSKPAALLPMEGFTKSNGSQTWSTMAIGGGGG